MVTCKASRIFPWRWPTCRATWPPQTLYRPFPARTQGSTCTWKWLWASCRRCCPCRSLEAGWAVKFCFGWRIMRVNGVYCYRCQEVHVGELTLRLRPARLRVLQDHHRLHHHLDFRRRTRERSYLGYILLAQRFQCLYNNYMVICLFDHR